MSDHGGPRWAAKKNPISRLIRVTRRSIKQHWARSWRLRGKLTSQALKCDANEYLKASQERLLFILGNGRSGTQLISSLLDGTEETLIFHEPDFDADVATMDALRQNVELAEAYWREFRSVRVFQRWMAGGRERIYGEVNGTIRYQAPAIRRLYPRSTMLLLARDGRGVVRSIMGWPHFYGPGSEGAYALAPLPDDPFFEEWPSMSRFERICWSWRDGNEFVMRSVPECDWIQVERITSDFDYFKEHVVTRTGVEIAYEAWLRVVSARSKNASSAYAFPAWNDWDRAQRTAFVRICGDTMTRLGYEL